MDRLDDPWRWTSFTTEDGLPSNSIEHVVEAQDGTIWVTTTRGLAWYDGFWWQEVGLPQVRKNERITQLVPGKGGELFAVCRLSLYIGGRDGFRRVPVEIDGKPINVTNVAPIDGQDDYFVQVSPDLLVFPLLRYRAGQFERVAQPDDALTPHQPRLLLLRESGAWLATDKHLYRWDGNGWILTFSPASGHCNVLKIAENRAGTALMQLADLQSNLTTWTWRKGESPREITLPVDEYIQAVDITDSDIFLTAFQSGVIEAGPIEGPWRDIPGLKSPRSARALLWSQDSGIWIGSENGLLLFRAHPQRWRTWRNPRAGGRNRVHCLLPRQDGTTWLGTGDGIVIIEASGGSRPIHQLGGQRLGLITGLAEDGQGRVWVGSGANFEGAWMFDGQSWRHFGPRDGLFAPRVHGINVDRSGCVLFLAMQASYRYNINEDPGVFHFDENRFEQMRQPDGTPLGRVYDICQGPDGSQWFATALGVARRRNNSWRWWRGADGLVESRVYTVAVTPDGRAWFGHEKQAGLGFIDSDEQIRYVDQINGQDRHFVNDLDVAPDGALWVAKDGAICRYQSEIWSTFGLAEGLPAAQVWSIAATHDEVLVGLLGAGLSRLQLNELRGPPPEVRIAQPIVDHQVALVRWRAQSYQAQIHPENIETRYQLDDEPWTIWSRVKEVKLTDLAPGDHRLRVQAHGLLAAGMPESHEIRFKVDRPFYLQVGFLGPLAGLAGLSLAAIAVQGQRRRRHQRALRESEQTFRQLTENIRDVFWLRDCETGRLLYVSPAHEVVWGDSVSHLYQNPHSWAERIHPEDRDRVIAAFRTDERRPSEQAVEYRIITSDGQTRWILDRGFPIRNERGKVVRVAGIAENITDRKEAELAQRRAAAQLHAILDNTAAVIYIKDLEGRYLLVNSRFEDIFDIRRDGLIGRTDYVLFPVEFADRFRANDLAAIRAQEAITIEEQALQPDGVHDFITVKFALKDADGAAYAVCGISTDISLLKRTEETLRRHAIAFDTITDALLMLDIDRRITDINPAGERMFGYSREEILGRPISDLLGQEDIQNLMPVIRRALDTEHSWSGEVQHYHKAGHAVLGDVSLVAVLNEANDRIGSIAVVRDVTERQLAEADKARLEAQLRHVQRIETIGKLTSSVSHDFSNLLTGIFLLTSMARKSLTETHPAMKSIDMIEEAALQARSVTSTLLNFAHRALTERKPVNLVVALAPTLKLLKRFLEPFITVQVDMPEGGEAWALADDTQLQQALMNLSLNARDAMPQGGTLRISLSISPAEKKAPQGSEVDGEIQLCISDKGVGMPPEVLERAFEPFFTTKQRGEGTGLGLSSVQSIVHSHHGRIRIESSVGRGTSVYIALPMCGPAVTAPQRTVPPQRRDSDGDTVLVVEDNPFVRSIIVSAIRAAGYEVISAGDGIEALQMVEPGLSKLRGAVVDLELPRRNGDGFIEDLHAVFPGLPVIRMTGRASEKDAHNNGAWLLRKPFQMSEFVEILNQAIG